MDNHTGIKSFLIFDLMFLFFDNFTCEYNVLCSYVTPMSNLPELTISKAKWLSLHRKPSTNKSSVARSGASWTSPHSACWNADQLDLVEINNSFPELRSAEAVWCPEDSISNTFPILWLLHSFCSLFHGVSRTLCGGYLVYVFHINWPCCQIIF